MTHLTGSLGDAYYSSLTTLAKSLVKTLKFFNCNEIYGVGGDFAANLLKAFENDLKMFPSSNEMHAGFSACAAGEIYGLGCCLTTYTVGSLPCITSAALAKAEGIPVVYISGAPGESEIGNGPLHHSVYASNDWVVKYDYALQSFKSLGIRAERLQGTRNDGRPNVASMQFYDVILHAFLKKEPVYVEIPRDIVFSQSQPIDLPKSLEVATKETLLLSGAEHIAEHIKNKLSSSQRPLIYIGEKIKYNRNLLEKVKNFCHTHQIPYATNLFAKGLLDETSPLSLNMYNGIFSTDRTRQYIEQEVDYILEICTGIMTQDASSAFATADTYIDTFQNKTLLKGTQSQCFDVLEVFTILEETFTGLFSSLPPQSKLKDFEDETPISLSNICDVLNLYHNKVKENFIYIPEIGNSFFASFSLITSKSSIIRSWLTNPWYAAMGTSLPFARVICNRLKNGKIKNDVPIIITGDGGFHFQLNELIHFLREDLFVVIILLRNDIFHLGKGSNSTMYNCSDSRFNYSKLIESYNGTYLKAESIKTLHLAFDSCLTKRKGVNFIELPVSTDPCDQCKEIKLLNLYIKARSGDPESIKKWEERLNFQ